jgi:hypothetical protein
MNPDKRMLCDLVTLSNNDSDFKAKNFRILDQSIAAKQLLFILTLNGTLKQWRQ